MFRTICASAHNIPAKKKSVHQIITSPPYWGLRRYSGEQMIDWPAVRYSPMVGLPEIEIAGCDPECRHEWGETKVVHLRGSNVEPTLDSNQNRGRIEKASTGHFCQKCGGWRGGLGQEPTIEAFIGHLILCLRNWREILRDDGTCFINLGDSYANDAKWGGQSGGKHVAELHGNTGIGRGRKATGLKPKNLCLVPERFRLAAQADGWIVRSQFPWLKASALPESAKDRPTNNMESWVMLTKSSSYYWDAEAILQEAVTTSGEAASFKRSGNKRNDVIVPGNTASHREDRKETQATGTRNRRTGDWLSESTDQAIATTKRWLAHVELVKEHQGLALDQEGQPMAMLVNPVPFKGSHFAAFPPGVVEPLILAGTSAKGVCPKCGAPQRRIIESKPALASDGKTCLKCGKNHGKPKGKTHDLEGAQDSMMADYMANDVFVCVDMVTIGWEASCDCNDGEPVPATVLDPFVGSGTVLEVATALCRDGLGVDISQQYLDEVLPQRFANGVQVGFQF